VAQTEGLPRRRRADGERTRRAILDAAARLATVEGLDGLSLGRLAQDTGMSKSGLFAHFGSKEELQLATIAAAEDVFRSEVLDPALAAPEGLPRLRELCEGFLGHVERGVFPGGCFFASTAAELDTRPGPLRDRVAEVYDGWTALIEGFVRRAQELGQLDGSLDPEQLAFEVNAMLAEANGLFLLRGDPRAFEMARRAIRARLGEPGRR
jgi:AcrR family transcriptional regulator